MGKRFVLVLDQITSGSKALLADEQARVVSSQSIDHKQYYPRPGWVEHDPIEILENSRRILESLPDQARVDTSSIRALALTNQRETVVVWNKKTGRPVCNAIVWQDRRTADMHRDETGWTGRPDPGQDRTRTRSVLFRHKNKVDSGSC